MILIVTMALIILSANGIIIPTSVWILYGISWALTIAKIIIDVAQKRKQEENDMWNKMLNK